ncbi:MAG: hypothetical protein MUE79_06545 [Nitratireductor sp.]|jgi:hypothetical protein|nr:hypothetical protein [Nitratireductor sp.]
MRRVFQFDGLNGGVLSVAESTTEAKVVFCIHDGDAEMQVSLSKEAFFELSGLRFTFSFPQVAETGETPSLKAA